MVMTYNSLKDDMQRYLERGNAADTEVFEQIPSLIQLAEYDIATKLKLLGFLMPATAAMTMADPVLQKPDRWRATASFSVTVAGRRTPLFPRSYEYCNAYWPDRTLTDVPRFYSDYDYYNWLITPTPALAYSFEVTYWELPALLSDVNQSNWLTDFAPNALLFGSLLQAEPFLKNDERVGTWKSMYDEFMAALDGQDIQRILDRTTVRTEV